MRKYVVMIVLGIFMWLFVFGNGGPAKEGIPVNVPAAEAQKMVEKTKPAIVRGFGNTPPYFIPNQGQMDEKALFCARTTRYNLWITKQGLVFDSINQVKAEEGEQTTDDRRQRTEGRSPHSPYSPKSGRDVSRLIFLKANKNPIVTAVEPAQHRVSYFKGNDKSQWRSRIPTSHAVCYQDIYKHIDLKVYGVEKQIEYDWVVKPGGNPGDIRFQYQEVKEVSIDEQGNLVVRTAFGKWIHKKPLAYQEIGKAQAAGRTDQRIEVDVKFKKTGKNTYGFALGEYDKSYELIIDPMVVAFSTYLGGSLNEELLDIAVDGTGAVIAVGYTYSSNFPTQGGYQGTLAGPSDSFISKFSPDGSSLVFSTYLGGSGGLTETHDITVDSSSTAFVTGFTESPNFPLQDAFHSQLDASTDAVVTELSGQWLHY